MPPRRQASVAAIILAAGDSIRMGSPKALVPIGAQTFLNKIIAAYRELCCQPIIVVAGRHLDAIRGSLGDSQVLLLRNPRPDRGAFSSLKIAAQKLPPNCGGFFVHPVDHPSVKRESLAALLAEWRGDFHLAVKPTFEGRSGHPVLLGKDWIEVISRAPNSGNLRELLRRHGVNIQFVPVSDEGVLLNINQPDDCQKIIPHE